MWHKILGYKETSCIYDMYNRNTHVSLDVRKAQWDKVRNDNILVKVGHIFNKRGNMRKPPTMVSHMQRKSTYAPLQQMKLYQCRVS